MCVERERGEGGCSVSFSELDYFSKIYVLRDTLNCILSYTSSWISF